ncbi:hypothetical protein [Sorangium sp. So ce1099]|uniref:hypothetical protein n=1 Tax=Sorangium sp. So ce1099 TaxID=3133331 RepID=UPI003F5F6167
MKSIAITILLASIVVGGCVVAAEPDPEVSGEVNETASEPEVEDIAEVSQALDSNCSARTCESCGGGKFRAKTVTWTKTYFPASGTYMCAAPSTVTYGQCQLACEL